MRLLSRLLVVLVVCLVAIALPAAPAQAYGEEIRLSPDSGVPGEEVTIRGYNFTADARVYIYYDRNGDEDQVAREDTDEDGYFRVTFEVPKSCTGAHDVRAYIGGNLKAIEEFTVEPVLIVDPEEGPVGTTVTVEGRGFAEDEENIELMYYPDGASEVIEIEDDITADEYGSWQTSFQIPPSPTGSHKIDATGDKSSLGEVEDATFKVTPGISIDKSSGSVGDNITMTGSGFEADERDITILFDGEAVATEIRADDIGYWEESFKVPEMPKGTYSVTAEGEQTDKEDISELSFEIKPDIVLSPDEGRVGMNLTVTGHGFDANKNIVIRYDASQKATARTNAQGSFSGVSFPVPEGKHGVHNVTAEDATENEAAAIFTMESKPPVTPTLISPPDGERIGFIGKVRPNFEWSEVSDDSGVYYSLQIATSANVTDTGFVNPLVSKEGLVGTNYTLEETEALSHGTYYWIVQAVDGAENESGWSTPRSFRAGLLPLWAFIVILVAVAGGIGAAVYFFVIKKRIYYY